MDLIQKLIRPAFALLEAHDRPKVVLLTVLLLLQSLLDVISVASIAPLALLIIQPEVLMKFPLLSALYKSFVFEEIRSFSILILSSIIFFLLIKHFTSLLIGNFKTKFIFSIADKFAKGVIRNFCRISYPGYYDLKSSNELTRIINLPTLFAHNLLLPLTVLITEGFILLLLIATLIFYNISAMLWLGIVLVPAILFYLLNKNKIDLISDTIKTKYPSVLEKFMALYDNLVEIKLYQKENIYSNQVEEIHREVLEAQALRTKLFQNSTRVLETSALLCLCLLIGYFIFSGTPVENSIAQISFFVAASVRAIPSINRIFIALLELKSNSFVVDGLQKFHKEERTFSEEAIEFHRNINLKNIRFGFPHHSTLFHNLSLNIMKGEKVAITGKSGSGKTTLFMMLMRFLKEDQGEVYVDDRKLKECHISSWRKQFAYVPQNAIIIDASVIENIAMGDENVADHNKIQALLLSLGLQSWLEDLPEGLSTRLGENGIKISGGQRQRLAIARALYQDPEILLLDEITNQLDEETEKEVWASLQKIAAEKTILMITHHLELLKEFDSVYELTEGRLQKRMLQNSVTPVFVK